jgi:hypothetical protein
MQEVVIFCASKEYAGHTNASVTFFRYFIWFALALNPFVKFLQTRTNRPVMTDDKFLFVRLEEGRQLAFFFYGESYIHR